jgi:thymidylate synthase
MAQLEQWRNRSNNDLITELKRTQTVAEWLFLLGTICIPDNTKSFEENVANNKAALPPCHAFFQFYVANGKLSCPVVPAQCWYILRSPFQYASYALLTMMIAQVCDLGRVSSSYWRRTHLQQSYGTTAVAIVQRTKTTTKMILNRKHIQIWFWWFYAGRIRSPSLIKMFQYNKLKCFRDLNL